MPPPRPATHHAPRTRAPRLPKPLRPALLLALLLALLTAALLPASALAQEPDSSEVEPVVEDVARRLDDLDTEAGNAEQLAELLTELAANPLDINEATAEQLALIPALSPALAQRIVRYRATNGPFGSIPAVRAVEGVTAEIFLAARPYLRIGEDLGRMEAPGPYPRAPSLRTITRGMRLLVIQRATRRLDVGRGFSDDTTRTTYAGSPTRLYTRLWATYRRRVSLNLTLDKDPGEPFRWAPGNRTYGYDHVAGHAAIRDFGRIRTLVVGDFTAEFGQGLVLWRALAFGKGRDPIGSIARSGRGLVPFGSTEENRYFRGAGATIRLTPGLDVTAFASRRTLDASLTEADTLAAGLLGVPSGALLASTLSTSGLHRTPSEIDRKDALRETVVGGGTEYAWTGADGAVGGLLGSGRVGAVGYHSRFDRPLAPGSRPDEAFDLRGEHFTMGSVYANVTVGEDYLVFGEVARAPDGAVGGVGGVLVDAGLAEALLLARAYPRDFESLHGFAFGERNGVTQNETGIYTGLRVRLSRRVRVGGYLDQYRFPWLRFGVPRPSSGLDARLVVEHDPRPWLGYYLQLQSETREAGADVPGPDGRLLLDGLREETRQSARLHGQYAFSRDLRLRTRLELTRFDAADEPASTGVMLYQDVRWQARPWLLLDGRLAFFDTDGFESRVFAYESDLVYAFSVPAFFGRGQRAYVLARVEPVEGLNLEIKYGVTRFRGVDTVGSGLDTVDGNRVREVRAQVRWRL